MSRRNPLVHKSLKKGTSLSFGDDQLETLKQASRLVGSMPEMFSVALAPLVASGLSVKPSIASAKGGARKPEIAATLVLVADPKDPVVKDRLIIGKEGTFKPRPKTIKPEVEEKQRQKALAVEKQAAEKRAARFVPEIEVKPEHVELLDKYSTRFPILWEVKILVGVAGMNELEAKTPGDPLRFSPVPAPSFSYDPEIDWAIDKGLRMVPDIDYGYLKLDGYSEVDVNELCELAPYMQASIGEITPRAHRSKMAKRPKLVARFDLDYDKLLFND